MKSIPDSRPANGRLRIVSVGITVAVLTILLGQAVRIAYGLNKDALKRRG